jgi:hypothetical protein
LATVLIATALAGGAPARASAPVNVGNGDDGADLEGATRIERGPIAEARGEAVALLHRLNTAGIAGLGLLLPEVEKSELYLAKQDVAAKLPEDQGSFHANMRGQLFARTFAEPHASTRFFPAAQRLDEDQLVALHVHEALHRALPPSVREDEGIVSAITLSIAAPDSTHDQVRRTVAQYVPEEERREPRYTGVAVAPVPSPADASATLTTTAEPIPETALIRNPSTFGYTYRHFQTGRRAPGEDGSPVRSMHVFQSFLYPFGGESDAFGIGLEGSLIGTDDGRESRTQAGPLSLSARTRLWSGRGFDIGAWGVASFNTLSADELKESSLGRDVVTLGLSMRKDLAFLYVENFLSFTPGGTVKEKLALQEVTHEFGNTVNVSSHVGASVGKLKAGGFAEVYLADFHRITVGEFHDDPGRYRLVAAGPEVTWRESNFAFSVAGRFLLNSTRGVGFEELGNVMGQGTGQGSLSGTVSVFF